MASDGGFVRAEHIRRWEYGSGVGNGLGMAVGCSESLGIHSYRAWVPLETLGLLPER